ncbi:MAG: exonuclease domain-containing protein [Caulobacteraceae bacterium]
MQFIALDVETANARLASICRIGMVGFDKDGREAWVRDILVDPGCEFDPINISKHGLSAETVAGAPKFAEAESVLRELLHDQLVVCHTHFDRTSLGQALAESALEPLACQWLDSARVVRRAWDRYADRGYGLADVASDLGIQFRHHEPVEDARTAGLILLAACLEVGCGVSDWPERLRPDSTGQWPARIERDPTGHGDLDREVVVITGTLSQSRAHVADLIAAAGGEVDPGVTRRTTMLVVGEQDLALLAGKTKSGKHLKAEKLISKGQPIRILAEPDLVALLG